MKQYKITEKQRALIKEYNRLAKKADRMMRELERFSRYEEFSDILKYAYRTAKADIEKWTPPGMSEKSPRWQRNMPMDTRSLKAKIKDIEAFINKPTATVSGVKRIYKKRAETFNEKYDTNFTWQQMAHFFEDGGLFDKGKDEYGSKTILYNFGKIQANKKAVIKKIENFNQVDLVIDDDTTTNEEINKMLSQYGYDIKQLLEG